MQYGQNVDAVVKAGKLVLTVDLSANGTPSRSGKSVVIGTTRGSVQVDVGDGQAVTVGLNVYRAR